MFRGTNLSLPTALDINSPPQFQALWNLPDYTIPAPSAGEWSGWTNWRTDPFFSGFLVIQRVNLSDTLLTYKVTLNNTSNAADASYIITRQTAPGVTAQPLPRVTLPTRTSFSVIQDSNLNLRLGDQLDLYPDATSLIPLYRYIATDKPKTFEFDGAAWSAK